MEPTPIKRSLAVIDVENPCDEPWLGMAEVGPNRRHCALCLQDVHNLSSMTHDEAEAFVAASAGPVCVQFIRRSDGTIVTSDCSPVRFRRLRQAGQGGLRLAAKIVGAVVAVLVAVGFARLAGFQPFGSLLHTEAVGGEMSVIEGLPRK